jgi:hypothetical protein
VESRAAEPILPLELFRNRVFATTSAIGFGVGFSLFGSVTFLPLYLQIVKGHSPTGSGLLMTPMMAGVLVTSIGSGFLISRYGRYRVFPIAGTALATLALYLLSRLGVTTSTATGAAYMLLLGLGLGMVMQVLVLAAQNAVPYRLLGVATSGSSLVRQVGGLIGVGAVRRDLLEPARSRARAAPRRRSARPAECQPYDAQPPARADPPRIRRRGRGRPPPRVSRGGGDLARSVRDHVAAARGSAPPDGGGGASARASPRLATTAPSVSWSGSPAPWFAGRGAPVFVDGPSRPREPT